MTRSYDEQSAFSERAFRELVWPAISDMCGGGSLRSFERAGSDLDTRGGIDAYQVFSTGIRSMAQRTQRLDDYEKPRTFTVRKSLARGGATEWEKRLDALDKGHDLPSITIQAYVLWETRRFVRAGIVHTRPFYQWARDPGFRDGPPIPAAPRTSWPPYGVIRDEPPVQPRRSKVPISFVEKSNRDDGNTFLIVPWIDIVMWSDVPFATTDGLVTAQSPREFFESWPDIGRKI